MFLLKKLTRLHWVLTMIKEYNESIQQKHNHVEQGKTFFVKKEKLNVTIQQNNIKMFNYDNATKGNINEHNPNWPQIFDHSYRILINGCSGSGNTNALLNLKKEKYDNNYSVIDKFYFILKIQMKQNINILLKNVKKYRLENLEDLKAFTEYSNNMQHVYKNIEEYKPSRKGNVLIVFDDVIADSNISNKKINQVANVLFIREKKLNISTVFITQIYLQVRKDVKLNCTHCFIMKI